MTQETMGREEVYRFPVLARGKSEQSRELTVPSWEAWEYLHKFLTL